eukprot:8826131-Pyramimonas_sp.AAC.1
MIAPSSAAPPPAAQPTPQSAASQPAVQPSGLSSLGQWMSRPGPRAAPPMAAGPPAGVAPE